MATTVSHAMRRYPATSSDTNYTDFNSIQASEQPPVFGKIRESPGGGSALSRSMRYAEPWLYGSVRSAPVLVAGAFPAPGNGVAGVGLVQPPLVQLCNCSESLSGTYNGKNKNGKIICKKCKGQRFAVGPSTGKLKYGTVRGYSTSTPVPTFTGVRAGTVRVTTSSRPSIIPSSSVDPYDLMRRSRLSCSELGSQFSGKSRSSLELANYSSSPTKSQSSNHPSRSSAQTSNVIGGRKSILECEVNPYDLMSTNKDTKASSSGRFTHYLDNNDYEDVDMPRSSSTKTTNIKLSHIPKLQNKSKKQSILSPKQSKDAKSSNEKCTDKNTEKITEKINERMNEKEINLRKEVKYKSILKKPSITFGDTNLSTTTADNNASSTKSGSHFYLPMPTFNSPKKKVQFLVEIEKEVNSDTKSLSPKREKEMLSNASNMNDSLELNNKDDQFDDKDDPDLDNEPCRLKRSLSERLIHELPNISFNDTMALRSSRNRTSLSDHGGSNLFEAVTDLQRLDGIGPSRSRPREPPPPPPPPSPPSEVNDRPATPPPRSVTELGSGYDVAMITETPKISNQLHAKEAVINVNSSKVNGEVSKMKMEEKKINTVVADTKNNVSLEEVPPSVPPRKRSNSKQPGTMHFITKKEEISTSTKSTLIKNDNTVEMKTTSENVSDVPKQADNTAKNKSDENIYEDYDISKSKQHSENDDKLATFEIPKITIKSPTLIESIPLNENISSTKIEGPEINYLKMKPSKTIVQINSPQIQVIPSTVHRLQIKNEFSDHTNYNSVSISESPQRKTSIMINGDDCYSTVNVNDDIPIYQSSVVVNDYDSSKIEINSGSKSSSVYITGDFQSNSTTPSSSHTSKPEERPKKTLVILDGNTSSSTPSSPNIKEQISGQSTPESIGKTFVILQDEAASVNALAISKEISSANDIEKRNKEPNKSLDNGYEKPSSEELQRLLKDPVEAVKRNLVPHVCGKADVERKTNKSRKSITSNSLVARLLEDPFLGSLAEGLETNTVAKLIEDSLLKLRSQDFHEDDKDACSEHDSCPPYELMEAGSDCYSNHSNRSSVTEDELGTRNKFYQLLADAALSEIDDHHYECIKANVDPIYEEIEIPPPLPANPPPPSIIDDLQIDKQFTTRSIFEGASKYDILSYLVDAKERGIVPEESYTYNFNNSGDVIVEEEDEPKTRAVFSSRVSHMSTVSDSSEDSSLVITAEKNGPQKSAEVERNDSGVGSETSKCSRSRYLNQPEASIACEDCDLAVDPQPEDGPLICKKCSKKRSERKETITEIVETEEKYSRDLQIILEEFYQPMLVAGLLTPEQLSAIFLNVEELLENSQALAERLRDTLEIALEQGDEDLLTVNIGKIFLEAAPMLHAFESYCVRQGPASLLLAGLEKEKELLRIFLRVSQMENTVLRRMNLNSFLMVPVQRVTKYPLLLARLYKVTPLHHESRDLLREAQHKIELHLSHMNSETKDVPSKLWRRISNNSGRRSSSEMDLVNIKLRKIAVDVLEWNHDEARFALEGRLLFTQPTDNNWRKGRTIKLTPVNALLVTNGKPSLSPKSDRNGGAVNGVLSANGVLSNDDGNALTFPRQTGVREAALLLVRDKGGRYSLLREPLYLDRCVIATDPAWQSYFEVQELLGKDTFIFKAEDAEMTRTWYRQLQYHAQGMGAWRKRRNALANIMINGMGSRS